MPENAEYQVKRKEKIDQSGSDDASGVPSKKKEKKEKEGGKIPPLTPPHPPAESCANITLTSNRRILNRISNDKSINSNISLHRRVLKRNPGNLRR